MSKKIKLTKGKFAIVDDKNFKWLNQWKWFARLKFGIWYAARWFRVVGAHKYKRRIRFMHQVILGKIELLQGTGVNVSHKNLNGLDNKESNLRVVSMAENAMHQRKRKAKTTSKYKGVSWNTAGEIWVAQIGHQCKNVYLGRFEDDEEEAARVYDKAARRFFGEHAVLNFPVSGEEGARGKTNGQES